MLHEIERHAIHSNETLGVALNTVNAMLQQHARLLSRRNQDQVGWPVVLYQTHQYMQFQYHMLESTRARSISIEQRSRNEINLVSITLSGHPQTSGVNLLQGFKHGCPKPDPSNGPNQRSDTER